MFRNLLYSFCLHLLFLLVFVFNDDINSLLNKKVLNINSLNINADFLLENDIKTTDSDMYADLTLREKIELYKISKKNSFNPQEAVKNLEQIKNIVRGKFDTTESDKEYILYLGPTDYRRYLSRSDATKEKADLESIVASIEEESESQEQKNVEQDIIHENMVKTVAEIHEKNTKKSQSATESKVFKTTNTPLNLMNIDPDKIFTRNDIQQIKEIIKRESMNNSILSVRERMNIQNQLIACYKNALVQTSLPSKVPVSVTIDLYPNGIINTKKIVFRVIDDENIYNERDYEEAMNNAKIALAYCNPIRNLPANKYTSWQSINFIFDAIKK